jgi:hypothetical protein
MSPTDLRNSLKERTGDYLAWLKERPGEPAFDEQRVLHPKWDFVFKNGYTYLNFHPDIRGQVQDILNGKVDRKYEDAASEISIHDFVGHMASSQALCWNVVLPMKKHDNFTPLFEVLKRQLKEGGLDHEFDFGIETAVVLELNAARDLGEQGAATSIDLYLRTAQGRICTIEFKLTEPDFGQCKLPRDGGKCDGRYGNPTFARQNDGYLCYLSKIGRRYWQLGGHYGLLDPTRVALDDADIVQRCPLNVFYQALRNLIVAKNRSEESPNKKVRGIFVLAADERNGAFWGPGNHFDCFKEYLKDSRGKVVPDVFRISIQDIVRGFSGSLSSYRDFFAVKYGVTFE